ncbi:Pls/PosA family non-ribosomal peptide synthetase [Kitasatospora sp. LaBMicrA B282]|uniref:Pls/PosA family non-ribosomal peptide synthetase n=1 Tax=Kitasatospora sp. LaBMicrA B282 TaxID=3420949 RepID=UPI003D0AFDE4
MTVAAVPRAVFDRTGLVMTGVGGPDAGSRRAGERLERLFEERCDRLRAAGLADRTAVDLAADADQAGDSALTYDLLDARANQLARFLLARGVRPGDRVGLLFDRALPSYVGMLAVLKAGAAYVPLDVGFPAERIAFITGDAGVGLLLTLAHLRAGLGPGATDLPCEVLCLDEAAPAVAACGTHRVAEAERCGPGDDLAYVIYTSGSTGRPKGVAVEHAAICNFVRVAAEAYGIRPDDRVYQGMTIAFDFSIEELWVPWLAGATVVPKPGGGSLVGYELHEFLVDRRITALCCVPTLLATLEEELPQLRFLLVSGEACPPDLVARWHRPGRRFLNVYGPTEATVSATWTTVHPERPVTIGVPLPTYSVVVLDPEQDRALDRGETGELGIAGIGLARGYLNRDELTERVFVKDFLGIADNPSGRIYRTGDLARFDAAGQIEYLGRIDTQVKVRGYRIELTEIESVLRQLPGIAQAVVTAVEPEPGVVELAGYYSLRRNVPAPSARELAARLRERLPGYMVPKYLERLDAIPMTAGDKADRRNLPAPTGLHLAGGPVHTAVVRTSPAHTAPAHSAPATATERLLAEALAAALRRPEVPVDSHFFDELGADSLVLARFCARVRERPGAPVVSMRDVYLAPTVRSLAVAVTAGQQPAAAERPAPAAEPPPAPHDAGARLPPVATWRYLLCGTLQALALIALLSGYAVAAAAGAGWVAAARSALGGYLRAVAVGGTGFAVLCAVPVVAKWLLIGRWRPREIRLWSLGYLRFWLVRLLVGSSPLRLFVGSPLQVLHLRLLGARIGRNVLILTDRLPVCTDLLTIGDGAVIRRDARLDGYRADRDRIRTGRITLGRQAFVGEASTLDMGVALGEGAQLGHSSSLHQGQAVPDGESWHGSPARRCTVEYRATGAAPRSAVRRVGYPVVQLLSLLLVGAPVLLFTAESVGRAVARWWAAGGPDGWAAGGQGAWAAESLLLAALCAAGWCGLLALAVGVPRLAALLVEPDRDHPLHGFRYAVHRAAVRFGNSRTLGYLVGDSSLVVHYLRALGYRLHRVVQTGSNFGIETRQDAPHLTSVGTGTMACDGLSIVNAEYSATSFRLRRTRIGARNFLGNEVVFPAGGRVGDNCLLATKVLVPLDGPVRQDTGLLGSPCFEIPRTVRRDARADPGAGGGADFRRRLAAKTRHNLVSAAVFALTRSVGLGGVVLVNIVAVEVSRRAGPVAVAAGVVVSYLYSLGSAILVERAALGFGRLRPTLSSIYEPVYWRYERQWKLDCTRQATVLDGTPFKPLVWRLLGVRVGRRVLDDGVRIPERTLVSIGDGSVLGAGSVLQGHSMEDGTFKSDRIVVGAGCTIGAGAFVHYGVTMADGSVLAADAFLMKGSEVRADSCWRGNPATELPAIEAPASEAPVRAARPELPGPGRQDLRWGLAEPAGRGAAEDRGGAAS